MMLFNYQTKSYDILKSNIYYSIYKETKNKNYNGNIYCCYTFIFIFNAKKCYYPDEISEIFIEINLKLFLVLLLMILNILEIIF